jgi:hypothetical protein
MTDIEAAALDLARRWRAHDHDDGASINTVFAVFGAAAALSRLLERHANALRAGAGRLRDFAGDQGAQEIDRARALPLSQQPRSTAAAAMIEHQLRRGHGRRVPMTAEAWGALDAYLRERLALLEETDEFWRDKRRGAPPIAGERVREHLIATRRVLVL